MTNVGVHSIASVVLVAAVAVAAAGCTISEPTRTPAPAAAPPRAPAPTRSPPNATVDPGGPLPAGLYDVTEQVAYDTCKPSRNLPPQVTIMKRRREHWPAINVPLPSFGFGARFTRRVESSVLGYSGSGMAHPKVCPGAQQTYKDKMYDITPTSFRISVDYEVADGWDCPNPRPQPMCRTRVVYEFRLASAACPSDCDGTVPGMRDDDVPPGPIALDCSC